MVAGLHYSVHTNTILYYNILPVANGHLPFSEHHCYAPTTDNTAAWNIQPPVSVTFTLDFPLELQMAATELYQLSTAYSTMSLPL